FYRWVEPVQRAIERWSPQDLQQLAAALTTAQESQSRELAVEAINANPTLRDTVGRLVIPRDAAAFWTMVAAILTVVAIVLSQR
ncbi:MAG TPA: hypothetical protein VMF14_15635, partial [Solirubrobacteraceae bacterium]|nr:hypothetical protein [Solirubrobacteraceae bacterium]